MTDKEMIPSESGLVNEGGNRGYLLVCGPKPISFSTGAGELLMQDASLELPDQLTGVSPSSSPSSTSNYQQLFSYEQQLVRQSIPPYWTVDWFCPVKGLCR